MTVKGEQSLQVNVTPQEHSKVLLEIIVDPAEVKTAWDNAYRKLARIVKVPGFRPGKAPRALVERYAGASALREEALEALLPGALDAALKDNQLSPVTDPHIEVKEFNESGPLVFTATVEVAPKVELGAYRDLDVSYDAPVVTPEEVEAEIENLRTMVARLETVEGGEAHSGSYVEAEVTAIVDGQEVDAEHSPHKELFAIDDSGTLPEVSEVLRGARPGDEREVTVTYPASHPNAKLAGKTATLRIRVNEIKELVKPPLDDEFARRFGGVDSVEELRKNVENTLWSRARARAREEFANRLMAAVVEKATVGELPESVVESRQRYLEHELEHELEHRGQTLEEYAEAAGKDVAAIHEQFRQAAEDAIRRDYVLEAIAKAENISVTEDDLTREIVATAAETGRDVKEIAGELKDDRVLSAFVRTVLLTKALNHVVDLNLPAEAKRQETAAEAREQEPAAGQETPAEASNQPEAK